MPNDLPPTSSETTEEEEGNKGWRQGRERTDIQPGKVPLECVPEADENADSNEIELDKEVKGTQAPERDNKAEDFEEKDKKGREKRPGARRSGDFPVGLARSHSYDPPKKVLEQTRENNRTQPKSPSPN